MNIRRKLEQLSARGQSRGAQATFGSPTEAVDVRIVNDMAEIRRAYPGQTTSSLEVAFAHLLEKSFALGATKALNFSNQALESALEDDIAAIVSAFEA